MTEINRTHGFVAFDAEAERKPEVQERLDAIAHKRTGNKYIELDGPPRAPLAVTDCPHCKQPSPMTVFSTFLCRRCVVIFCG